MSKQILILNGSPRIHGNTAALIDAFTAGAEAAGHTDVYKRQPQNGIIVGGGFLHISEGAGKGQRGQGQPQAQGQRQTCLLYTSGKGAPPSTLTHFRMPSSAMRAR